MQWLAQLSVRRPVFATVLILVILVLGVVGYTDLGVDRFPKVDFPVVMVVTRLPGAAPEEVETEISDKLEEAVNTISGIDELRSVSSEGVSQVIVSFVLEKDGDVAAQEVREKVSAALGELPAGVDAPMVMKFDADGAPVLTIAVNARAPIAEITEFAQRVLRRRLESTPGVGQVSVLGGAERQVNVTLDAARLRAFGLTALDVERTLRASNLTVPGGRIESGPSQQVLRVRGRVTDPAEIAELVVREQDGSRISLADVAQVSDGVKNPDTAALDDGQPAVLLSIRKQSGANSVAVADEIRQRIAEIGPELPAGYSLTTLRDQTETIRASVASVKEHLGLGAVFAGAVVLLFLGSLRSTLIAAVAIPVSIIGTFALMRVQGFSLDTVTLLALALAVGIVIDDAIVVLENIFRFIEEKRLSPAQAAVAATREIGLAVLATTLSLIAVFVPVAFMSGIVGRFLKSFGLTMAFSILVSLVVSFTLTPMLSARWLVAHRPVAGRELPSKRLLERVVDRCYAPVERLYVAVLAWAMRHRWVVVSASALSLAATVPLMIAVPKGFLPKSDDAQFEIKLRAPEGTSLEATALIAERVARQTRALAHVTSTVVTIGDNNDRTPNLATVYVKLTSPETRALSQDQIMALVRRDVAARQPKTLRIDVSEVSMFGGGDSSAPIQYELTGPDLKMLERYNSELVERVRRLPGAVDVSSSFIGGKPELSLRVDRERAADLGVSVADIAATLRLFVGGTKVTSYQEAGQSYDVFVRGTAQQRADLEGLSLVTVPSHKLGTVPLLDVVNSEDGSGPANITRLGRRRQVMLTANLAPGAAQSEVMDGVERQVRALNLPSEYRAAAVGQSREMQRTAAAFATAFLLAFVFMYLVLAAQFESWLHPITILLALPLTLPFALVSLLLFRQALDIYSMLGLLVLFGVVKKNAILQIDHTNQLRQRGMGRLDAILAANRDRLRPILMTTLAFVAGMLPLVFSSGIGAGYNRATAGVIVGGQILSLLLTLLATPVTYSLLDDLAAWFAKTFRNPERDEARRREVGEIERMGEDAALAAE
jgi:hydrophobic/amphiphilic exporter-1 (mainly G- bacteria), HAE1 family